MQKLLACLLLLLSSLGGPVLSADGKSTATTVPRPPELAATSPSGLLSELAVDPVSLNQQPSSGSVRGEAPLPQEKLPTETALREVEEGVLSDETGERSAPGQLELVQEADVLVGTTPQTPILVATVAELMAGLNLAAANNWPTVYLQLTNDLIYQYRGENSDQIRVGTNMVLDGHGYHYYYEPAPGVTAAAARVATARFSVTRGNLSLTFKNIHFGDPQHGIGNYYGLVRDGGTMPLNLYFDQVSYYANQGGQPFVFYNTASLVSFSGHNDFYVAAGAGTDSQEWLEGNRLEFQENSDTTIYHYTETNLAFIYARMGGQVTIDVKAGAKVKIETNKRDLVYGSSGLAIQLAADADFEVIHKESNLSFTSMDGTPTIFTMGPNSKIAITSRGQVINSGGVRVNVNNAAYFLLNYIGGVSLLEGGRTWIFNPQQSGLPYYWQGANGEQLTEALPATGRYLNLDSNVFNRLGRVTQVIYHRRIQMTAIDIASQVGPDLSQIDSSVQDYQPRSYRPLKLWYKLSRLPLLDEKSLTTDAGTQQLDGQESNVLFQGETDKMAVTIGKRPPGHYFLYWKMAAYTGPITSPAAFVQTSYWQVKEIDVPKSGYYLEIPRQLFFEKAQKGPFNMRDSGGIIRNRGNFPVYFTITHVSEARPLGVQLTAALGEKPRQFTLGVHSANGGILGPLVLGENHVAGMRLDPFTDGQDIYLSGSYSGPTKGVQQVALDLTYRLYEAP